MRTDALSAIAEITPKPLQVNPLQGLCFWGFPHAMDPVAASQSRSRGITPRTVEVAEVSAHQPQALGLLLGLLGHPSVSQPSGP